MFEFYNHVKEITLIFQEGRLIFANESALHFFNCYFHTIEGKPISFFFQNHFAEGTETLSLCGGGTLTCECKHFSQDGKEFCLFHQLPEQGETEEMLLTTPKALYDPLMIGKAAIMTQSIADPIQNIIESAEHLLRQEPAQLKLREELLEISKNAEDIYRKTKRMLEEYATLTLHQERCVSCFDLREAVQQVCRRIEEYLILEKLPVKIHFSSRDSVCLILADKQQVMKAITGLVSGMVRYLTDHEEKGRINVKVYAEQNWGNVVLEDNAKETDSILEKLAYTDTLSSDRHVMGLQMMNSLIENNNGSVSLSKSKGIGMRYTVRFPLTDKNRFAEKERDVNVKEIVFHEMEFFMTV